MANKRRKEITIETHQLTIIRTRGGKPADLPYCHSCRARVAGFRRSHAALIFQVAFADLESLTHSGQIHSAENGDLCGASLAAFFSREIRYVED